MRITTGTAKGRTLRVPASARPTKDSVRQAIFSILGGECTNLVVADLFAGSGALGLEALSRGAIAADFVDSDRDAVRVIQQNIERCGFSGHAEVYELEAFDFLATAAPHSYDLIFADPPYADDQKKGLMKAIARALKPEGVLIWEEEGKGKKKDRIDTPDYPPFTYILSRKYGKTIIHLLQRTP